MRRDGREKGEGDGGGMSQLRWANVLNFALKDDLRNQSFVLIPLLFSPSSDVPYFLLFSCIP